MKTWCPIYFGSSLPISHCFSSNLLLKCIGSKRLTSDLNLNLEECQTTTHPIFSLPEAVQVRHRLHPTVELNNNSIANNVFCTNYLLLYFISVVVLKVVYNVTIDMNRRNVCTRLCYIYLLVSLYLFSFLLSH